MSYLECIRIIFAQFSTYIWREASINYEVRIKKDVDVHFLLRQDVDV